MEGEGDLTRTSWRRGVRGHIALRDGMDPAKAGCVPDHAETSLSPGKGFAPCFLPLPMNHSFVALCGFGS